MVTDRHHEAETRAPASLATGKLRFPAYKRGGREQNPFEF